MSVKQSGFECSRGDLTIRGLKYLPGEFEGRLPTVVLSHGFMSNYDRMVHYAEQFAEWGFAAFCYDFCGGGPVCRSDGATTDMSVLSEREDLKAVISYVKGQPEVDAERLIAMGNSQGGMVTALTGAELQGELSALILFYPALCIPDDARAGKMTFARFDPLNIPDTIECGPMLLGRVYPEAVLGMDPMEEIRSFAGPVLIIHGTADSLVNVSYSEKAYEAYCGGSPEEHPEKRLILIEDGEHGFSEEHDKIAISGIEAFLRDIGLL